MKKKGLTLLLLGSLSTISYAEDFVTIIKQESANYESGNNYIVEYGEWVLTSSSCSVDKKKSDIYLGKTFNQTENCNDEFERTVITKITNKDGVEKVISENKENKKELKNKQINIITGTHLEKSCNDIITKGYGDTDGIYRVGDNEDNFDVYCDMRTTSGWTLIAKINTSNVRNINEPQRFFVDGLNDLDLLSPNMTINAGIAGLGMNKISKLNITGLSNVNLIQEFSEKSIDFYKTTNKQNLNTWFISDELTETKTCTDEDLTQNCDTSKFSNNSTYLLTGMNLSKYGYIANGDIHFRLNNNNSSYYSSVCSNTLNNNNNEWGDLLDEHWGNGMLIYLK